MHILYKQKFQKLDRCSLASLKKILFFFIVKLSTLERQFIHELFSGIRTLNSLISFCLDMMRKLCFFNWVNLQLGR